MDEVTENVIRQRCKVKIGDYFYKNRLDQKKPDRIEVIDIRDTGTDYIITGRYIYHVDGPKERSFSNNLLFRNEGDYTIERKGVDI